MFGLAARVNGLDLPLVEFLRYSALSGSIVTILLIVRKEQERAIERAESRAIHDPLTGLYNRDGLERRVTQAQQQGGVGTMFLLDLNNFKEINDSLGHSFGDRVLVSVAQRLLSVSVGRDVGRLGGDEFCVFAADVDDIAACDFANRIQRELGRVHLIDGLTLESSASCGVAVAASSSQTFDGLIRCADIAMYQSKRTGRQVVLYRSDDDHSSVRRLTLSAEIRHAIDDEQLDIWYQPIMHIGTGEIRAAEALVRWNHPAHGLLLPGEFVELAEVSGAIDPMTRWVIEHAVMDAHLLHQRGFDLRVSANLSARNFRDRNLLVWMHRLLIRHGMPPGGLLLELTETQIAEDPVNASAALSAMADFGVGAALDDFGTGYSSLSMLRHIKVSTIKIDRSFVQELIDSREAEILVRSMIELGHSLGCVIVAEGVVDRATLDRLHELECDYAQGYYISRPVPF